jgi:putative PIG3 family NAD(P)H quinone oxidoreductase
VRAVVISSPGGPEVLEVREVPVPRPGPGEILVRVHAAGLNRADILQRKGHYPAPPGVPADIPGLDFAGEVAGLGAPTSPALASPPGARRWSVGDRVMGLVAGGACAEYVVTHGDTAIAVPEGWSFVEAAAVPEVFLTAYDALIRQMRLTAGESVLIHAVSSGVGTAAVQLARAWGARTLGTSRSAEKLGRAAPLGLDVAIDTSREDFADAVQRGTGGRGVDVVLDLVGGPALEGNLKALTVRGRMIVVGLTAGRTAPLDLGLVLHKRLTIVGTALRSRSLEEKAALTRDFEREVMPLLAAGRVAPVLDRVFPMAEVAEAHRVMEANAHFGKIVLAW